MKKAFGKMGQYVSEKTGGDKTEMDEQFKFMEGQTDAIKDAVDGLIKKTEEYLQPNPNIRTKMSFQDKLNRGKGGGKKYPQPEGELGDVMMKGGQLLCEDSVFGSALLHVGDVERQIAEARHQLDAEVQTNFIKPLQDFEKTEVKTVQSHRKKLNSRRLDYDAKRKNYTKHGDDPKVQEEFRVAEGKFEESKESALNGMMDLQENEAEQVRQLMALVDAQLTFHQTAMQLLEQSREELAAKVGEAQARPRAERAAYTPRDRAQSDLSGYSGSGGGGAEDYSGGGGGGGDGDGYGDAPYGVALYDFDAENDEELNFRADDHIILTERIDENWLRGEVHGQQGIFPSNYVQVYGNI